MKNIKSLLKSVYPALGSLLVLIVLYGGVKPASVWGLHQPKVPKIK